MRKKVGSIMLCLSMLLTLCQPLAAAAGTASQPLKTIPDPVTRETDPKALYSGTCGEKLTWTISDTGELHISGIGAMDNYSNGDPSLPYPPVPWKVHQQEIKRVVMDPGITAVGTKAFSNCGNLISVTIPESVETIDIGAFSGCSALKSVSIPNSVTTLGSYVFSGCTAMETVRVPAGIGAVPRGGFLGCARLKSVVIADGITCIDYHAFQDCGSLVCATIPASITEIRSNAFQDSGLKKIFYSGTEERWAQITIDKTNTVLSAAERACGMVADSFYELNLDTQITGGSLSLSGYNIFAADEIVTIHVNPAAGYRPEHILVDGQPIEGNFFPVSGNHTVSAEFTEIRPDQPILDSGICGNTVYWTLYQDGELRISGTGVMNDYPSFEDKIPWSKNISEIRTLVIEPGVTAIGARAFSECVNLTSADIPDSVQSIGNSAFSGCSSLGSVTLPPDLSSIGTYLFYGCTSLASVTIRSGVVSIGEFAFSFCEALTSVTIPDGVQTIGKEAFIGCSNLTSVTIPDSVQTIGTSAFSGCSSLTSVTIPDGVQSIGQSAFQDCRALSYAVIPDSVSTMGRFAFDFDSDSLGKVFYAGTEEKWKDLTAGSHISAELAYGVDITKGLHTMTVSAEIDHGSIAVSGYNLYAVGETVTVTTVQPVPGYCLSHILVDGKPIDGRSFTASGSHSISAEFVKIRPEQEILHSGSCGKDGQNVQWVLYDDGELRFSGHGRMEDYAYDSLHEENDKFSPWDAYRGEIKSVVVEAGVTSVGDYACYKCPALTSAMIGSDVSSVGESAFSSCNYLTTVRIDGDAVSLQIDAFYPCMRLASIEFMGDAPKITAGFYTFPFISGVDGNFTICYHEGTTGWTTPRWATPNWNPSWGEPADYPCFCSEEKITDYSTLDDQNRNSQGILFTLSEPMGTAVVGDGTEKFNNSGYTGSQNGTVVIPHEVIKNGRSYEVTGIGKNAFSGQVGSFPYNYLFRGNSVLKEVRLEAAITFIDAGAFSNCPNFKRFVCGSGAEGWAVSDGILYDSTLKTLWCYPSGRTDKTFTVPDTVSTIAQNAFDGALNLKEIVVPDTVTMIRKCAFANCEALEKITLPFLGGNSTDNLPFGFVTGPEALPCLKEVVITGSEQLKGGDFAYRNGFVCPKSVESISLPACGTTIPENCFSGCENLKVLRFAGQDRQARPGVLTIPEGVTSVEYGAFRDCSSFTEAELPASLTSLGSGVFSGCTGIRAYRTAEGCSYFCTDRDGVLYTQNDNELVAYPSARPWPCYNVSEKTAAIRSGAFQNCIGLRSLCIPMTTRELDSFQYNCPNLTLYIYAGSPADIYATEQGLTICYIDGFQPDRIQICNPPADPMLAKGREDLSGLYVVQYSGSTMLQLDDYTVSYSTEQSGKQMLTVEYQGLTDETTVLRYDPAKEVVLSANGVRTVDGGQNLIVLYDQDGRMIEVKKAAVVGGKVRAVVSKNNFGEMDYGKAFALDANSCPVDLTKPVEAETP